MSVFRYDQQANNGAVRNGHTSSNIIAVVIGGGGFTHFSPRHPCVLFALRYAPTVYSIVLPYHEQLAQHRYKEGNDSIHATINTMKEILTQTCTGKTVLFIAYSMGGLFLLHLHPHLCSLCAPDSIYIVIGTGMNVSVHGAGAITQHWQEVQREQATLLIKMHGDEVAVNTLITYVCDSCGRVDSPLYQYSEQEMILLVKESNRVWFIHGEMEEPFPIQDLHNTLTQAIALAKSRSIPTRTVTDILRVVPCGHFNYFSPDVWPVVRTAAEQIISQYWEHTEAHTATPIRAAL